MGWLSKIAKRINQTAASVSGLTFGKGVVESIAGTIGNAVKDPLSMDTLKLVATGGLSAVPSAIKQGTNDTVNQVNDVHSGAVDMYQDINGHNDSSAEDVKASLVGQAAKDLAEANSKVNKDQADVLLGGTAGKNTADSMDTLRKRNAGAISTSSALGVV